MKQTNGRQKAKKAAVTALIFLLVAALAASLLYIFYLQRQETPGVLEPQAPEPVMMQVDDTITIRVYAGQAEDMYGYQFKLNYDEYSLEFVEIESLLEEIGSIFQKPFEGHLLVGATSVGKAEGCTGEDIPVCEIVMSAKTDEPITGITISEVNVVDSSQEYVEGVGEENKWRLELVA